MFMAIRKPALMSGGEFACYRIFYTPTLVRSVGGTLAPVLRRAWMVLMFAVGAPWLLAWWGVARYVGMLRYFVLQNSTFELDYPHILNVVRPNGVLHVGANVGQEAQDYASAGVRRVVWIEAQPSLEESLRAAVTKADAIYTSAVRPGQPGRYSQLANAGPQVLMAAVSDESKRVRMTCTDNSISSSLLPLGWGHKTFFPFIRPMTSGEHLDVVTITMKDLLHKEQVDTRALDMMYLDTQGSELSILRGCGDELLSQMRAIVTEVSTVEQYKGGCMMHDLDEFLSTHGLERTLTQVPSPVGHGNALYERVRVVH